MATSTLYYVKSNMSYQDPRRFILINMGENNYRKRRKELNDRESRDRIIIHKMGPNSYRFQIYRSRHAFWNGARTGKGTTAKQCLHRAYAELLK
ncbi:hypothetical protein [Mesorhizobium sp. SP-1A]|uniref:hypothetical protein n=1 Tax=Mesorhizobium sp. SP-1A TaxID=3077840 RepID=UPI0028F741A8|nr:hypothetical protein [Mesorhizobium sp. SP-1A]